jgi:hypothetical protein
MMIALLLLVPPLGLTATAGCGAAANTGLYRVGYTDVTVQMLWY